ncbi:MAG: sulfotransferase domain-containing protein [Candidatus Babeliales bacterium]|nr:sulfotransferase domain-containing protein [Candidatus Babeliales bacterium]
MSLRLLLKHNQVIVSCVLFLYISTISSEQRPVFFTSIPKAGTHLIGKCLSLLTGKEQKNNMDGFEGGGRAYFDKIHAFQDKLIFHKHLVCNEHALNFVKEGNFITFFTLRDPRDQLVSLAYWMKKYPKAFAETSSLGINQLITYLVNKKGHFIYYYDAYIGWIKQPDVCTIKFEDLVGPQGGGTSKKQIAEISKIARHLNLKITNADVIRVVNNLWGKTGTFRSGKIGSWKTNFTQKQKNTFKKNFGQLLIDLGYEKDLNW